MTPHDQQLADDLRSLLAQAGYDRTADVVPSASGGPLQTDQRSDAFLISAKEAFEKAVAEVEVKVKDDLDVQISGTSTRRGSKAARASAA